MTTHTTPLLARQQVAEGTMAFLLEKPAGFEFRPGQAMDVRLPAGGAAEPLVHAFSIVSAPRERELMFATRMRDSAYKRALGALPVGARVDVGDPFGSLTLHNNPARAAVLVAGGIGITPFMSMWRHAAQQGTPQDVVLLYSNRRPEDTAFLAELQQLAERHPKLRLAATMTDMVHSAQAWDGANGMIDSAFVLRAIQNLASPIYYVSGPPALVQAMQQTLAAAGVDSDDVRSEEFHGY